MAKRCSILAAILAPALGAGGCGGQSTQTAKPNIVFILADDLGWDHVGYHGSEIQTPNIDRLAAAGARLEHCYAMPQCVTSRGVLLTGRYTIRWRALDGKLPKRETTIAQALKSGGYRTAICGKWHMGAAAPYRPEDRGFDHQYGCYGSSIDYYTHARPQRADWYRNGRPLDEEGYATELIAREASRLIAEHDSDAPLFLYVPFTAVHAPYQAPAEYLERYAHIADRNDRVYAAMVTCLDDAVGTIVKALSDSGLRENTLIVFCADNGAALERAAERATFRGEKGSMYEGGVRVPAIVAWHNRIPAGTVINEPVHFVDWFPTLTQRAGITVRTAGPLDGRDLWPMIVDGAASPHDDIFIGIDDDFGAIRRGKWKLFVRYEALKVIRSTSLYDLSRDPAESIDLAADQPQIVQDLLQRLLSYQAQVERPAPG